MMDFDVREKRFEQDIADYLTTQGGYTVGDPKAFDRKLALDTTTFVQFVQESQPRQWERFTKIYGSNSEKQIVDRFCGKSTRPICFTSCPRVYRPGDQVPGSLLEAGNLAERYHTSAVRRQYPPLHPTARE